VALFNANKIVHSQHRIQKISRRTDVLIAAIAAFVTFQCIWNWDQDVSSMLFNGWR
jgi:hypothetical protein